MNKALKRFVKIFTCIVRINWIRFFACYSGKSNLILWIYKPGFKYLGSDEYIWDFGTISSFIKQGKKFRIVMGSNIGKESGKQIFYTLKRTYNEFGFENYTHVIQHIASQLEQQGNRIYPKASEAIWWENKGYMHRRFKELGVSEPDTVLFNSRQQVENASVSFPYLVKAEHSCSARGVYKINDKKDLSDLFDKTDFLRENNTVIVQQLINMRKDLRVIIVKNEIVLFYWRINLGSEWKPTSTSYGSGVDFDFFPEQWREHIMSTFKKLDITTGAFDVTWHNDDLSTTPLYLEVSPVYQPNPKINMAPGKVYADYKKNFRLTNSWDVQYVDLAFRIKDKQVRAYLNS